MQWTSIKAHRLGRQKLTLKASEHRREDTEGRCDHDDEDGTDAQVRGVTHLHGIRARLTRYPPYLPKKKLRSCSGKRKKISTSSADCSSFCPRTSFALALHGLDEGAICTVARASTVMGSQHAHRYGEVYVDLVVQHRSHTFTTECVRAVEAEYLILSLTPSRLSSFHALLSRAPEVIYTIVDISAYSRFRTSAL